MERRAHWEAVWTARSPSEVSWYQPSPDASLRLIHASGLGPEARVVDVGGGASTLVDALLAEGYRNLTVLDIAEVALMAAKRRLGKAAAQVEWLVQDVTAWRPSVPFDIWHDRAVFHFLVEATDRQSYREALHAGVRPGGTVIIATFAPDGPERCSGLPVMRYSPVTLAQELGEEFALAESSREEHRTPGGATQRFAFCRFRRRQ